MSNVQRQTFRVVFLTASFLTLIFITMLTRSPVGPARTYAAPAQNNNGVQIISASSNKCADIIDGSTSNGAGLQQWDCYDGVNQKWTFLKVGPDYYKIVSNNSGKCLEVADWSTNNGARVQQYDCHGGDNQLWDLRAMSGNYQFVNVNTIGSWGDGKCLDLKDSSSSNGAEIYLWDCHTGKNQQWAIASDEPVQIRSAFSDKCVDVADWSTDNWASIQQYRCHGGNNQLWNFEVVDARLDYYKIISEHSGKCLEVADWSTDNRARVQQYDCHGGDNQLWRRDRLSSGNYQFVNVNTIGFFGGRKCLDLKESSAAVDHGEIYLWECHNGENQQWYLTYPKSGGGGSGLLVGKTIVINPGHGVFWYNGANIDGIEPIEEGISFRTQRPQLHDSWGNPIIEDFLTPEFAKLLRDFLESEGATVYFTRNVDSTEAYPNYQVGSGVWDNEGTKIIFNEPVIWSQVSATRYLRTLGLSEEIWGFSNTNQGEYAWDQNSRPLYANHIGADLLISLHTNANRGPGSGTMLLYNNQNDDSLQLSQSIEDYIVNNIRLQYPEWKVQEMRTAGDTGEDPKAEVRLANMPTALVEIGYHDNPSEATKLLNPRFQCLAAEGIYKGILEYYGHASSALSRCGIAILSQHDFIIMPGETILFTAQVPASQSYITFATGWPGSDVVMTLTSPSGRVIGRDTSDVDVVHDVGPIYENYTIAAPESGEWQVNLFGADVSPEGEEVRFTLTASDTPPPPPPPKLACVEEETLVLNLGSSEPCGSRNIGEGEINETFVVEEVGDGEYTVTAFGLTQTYDGVTDILAEGEEGDDKIELVSVTVPAILSGGEGNDILQSGAGDDTLSGGPGHDTINGNDGADTINGDAGDDTLSGNSGNDTVNGGDGADIINGDADADTLNGDDGADNIYGGADDDNISGGADNDSLHGDDGHDTIHGNAGDDAIYGDEGNDTLYGDSDADTINGGSGDDLMYGNSGNDTMHGGDGNDNLEGNQDNDILYGDAGQDNLIGGSQDAGATDGDDIIHGGDGSGIASNDYDVIVGDNAQVSNTGQINSFNLALTRDIQLYDIAEITVPVSFATFGNDQLYGESGDDLMYGQGGDDLIDGGAGEDYLEGNDGNDNMSGGLGNDDMVGGTGRINDDPATGTNGRLDGDDLMNGNEGFDVMAGDNAILVRTIADGQWQSNSFNDGIQHETRLLLDMDSPSIIMVSGEDIMYGDQQDDLLYGQGSHDEIWGSDGDDFIEGNADDDTIYGGNGADDLIGGTTVAALTDAGDNIYGGAGADVILGDNGTIERPLNISGEWIIDPNTNQPARAIILFDVETVNNHVSQAFSGSDVIYGNEDRDLIFGQGNDINDDDGDGHSNEDPADGIDNDRDGRESANSIGFDCLDGVDNDGDGLADSNDPDCQTAIDEDGGGDEIYGGAGPDYIEGNHGSDWIMGDGGEDDIIGGNSAGDGHIGSSISPANLLDGDDVIDGGAEDDVILGDNSTITRVTTEDGAWQRLQGFGYDIAMRLTTMATVPETVGAFGNDHLIGGPDHDDLYGQLGDDFLEGNDGEDAFVGDLGLIINLIEDGSREQIIASKSPFLEDTIYEAGTLSRETVLYAYKEGDGAEGNDLMLGGNGNDSMHGGAGADMMNGNADEDHIFGGDGNDVAWGGPGHDHLWGGHHEDYLDVKPRLERIDGNGRHNRGKTTVLPADPPEWFTYAGTDHYQDLDIIYGGWDRDVMQANLGGPGPQVGDRLLDWVGVYNLYYTCPAAYGEGVITRSHAPHVIEFLQQLAAADGAMETDVDGMSGFREIGVVFPNQGGRNANPPHPENSGHFTCN